MHAKNAGQIIILKCVPCCLFNDINIGKVLANLRKVIDAVWWLQFQSASFTKIQPKTEPQITNYEVMHRFFKFILIFAL